MPTNRGARAWWRRSVPNAAAVLLAVIVAAAAHLAIPATAAPPTADRIDKAVKDVLSDSSIQKGLSVEAPKKDKSQESGWLADAIAWLVRAVGSVAPYLLWAGVILAGGLLLFLVGRELLATRLGWRDEADAEGPASGTIPGRAAHEDLLAVADRLAGEGAFAEAVHTILMHCLRYLDAIGDHPLRRSLTAREILRRAPVPEGARHWISVIVAASEVSHFGGHPASADTYGECRTAFVRFAEEAGGAR